MGSMNGAFDVGCLEDGQEACLQGRDRDEFSLAIYSFSMQPQEISKQMERRGIPVLINTFK